MNLAYGMMSYLAGVLLIDAARFLAHYSSLANMAKKTLICITFLMAMAGSSAIYASSAEDEVQHAQLWREMKADEAKNVADQLKDAEDDYQKAKKKMQEAQKNLDEATAKREALTKQSLELQKVLKSADDRLDKAWAALENERRASGK